MSKQAADPKRAVMVRLPVSILERLDHEVAQANESLPGVSRADLIRGALVAFLDLRESQRKRRR